MVDLWRLRHMSLEALGSREAELCLKKLDGLTSDEQLEFQLIGKVKREHRLEVPI